MKLDKDFIKAVSGPIWTTWNYVSPDAGDCDNEEALELCLDADRMTMLAQSKRELEEHKAADALIDAAIKEHGYDAVMAFLDEHIKLA
jgi:hypothetical protein